MRGAQHGQEVQKGHSGGRSQILDTLLRGAVEEARFHLRTDREAPDGSGLVGQYWANTELSGAPELERIDAAIDFLWTLSSPAQDIPSDWYSARWTGRLRAPATGVTRLGVAGNDGYRLWLDGELILDNWRKRSVGTQLAEVDLAADSEHDLRLEFFESVGNARLKLVWDGDVLDEAAERIGVSERLALPSNVEVKDALRRYQGLYGGTAHQENLERLRRIAVQAMQMLDELRLYTNMAARRSIAANYRAIQTEIGNQILLAPTGFMGNVGRALRLGYGLAKFSHSGRGFAEVTCAIGAGCGVTHSWSY